MKISKFDVQASKKFSLKNFAFSQENMTLFPSFFFKLNMANEIQLIYLLIMYNVNNNIAVFQYD